MGLQKYFFEVYAQIPFPIWHCQKCVSAKKKMLHQDCAGKQKVETYDIEFNETNAL